MGRKKGSLNKKTLLKLSQPEPAVIKRGRGRPRKVNIITPSLDNQKILQDEQREQVNISSGSLKDLKRQIRALKKLKLQMKSGSKDRIDTHRKIQALKKQLNNLPKTQETETKYEPKERKQPEPLVVAGEKYPDNNGCSYFSICKGLNSKKENVTCHNPIYFMEKLNRKCSELKSEG